MTQLQSRKHDTHKDTNKHIMTYTHKHNDTHKHTHTYMYTE